jgi:hypothetical protein
LEDYEDGVAGGGVGDVVDHMNNVLLGQQMCWIDVVLYRGTYVYVWPNLLVAMLATVELEYISD